MEISEKRIGKDNILLGFFFFFCSERFCFYDEDLLHEGNGFCSAL